MATDDNEIKPLRGLGDTENGNTSHCSVSEMISSLKSSFRPKDFANTEAVLLDREEKSKMEIKTLRGKIDTSSYKFEEERLEKMGLADELRKCKKELEEMRGEVSKLRSENIVLSGREKVADEQCKRLTAEAESLREKAHENIELWGKICELENENSKLKLDLELERSRFVELEKRVLKLESGLTMLSDQDDLPANNNDIAGEIGNSENGRVKPVETTKVEELSNVASESPLKCNGHSSSPGSRGLPSQNMIEISDSDDDCAPVENPSEKRIIRPTENSPPAHISAGNGTAAIKRKQTSSIDVGEGENGGNDALSEKTKMQKFQEPVGRPDGCTLNHCSTPRKDFMVSGQHVQQAESEQRSRSTIGFPLAGLYCSEESSVSSSSDSDDDSDEFDISFGRTQLASGTQRKS